MKVFSIPLEELDQKALKCLIVDYRIRIIKIEIDVDKTLLGR